jgi:superoxide oxidase
MKNIAEPVKCIGSTDSGSLDRFDRTSIALHWLTVLLIVIQFTTILARELIGHQSELASLLFLVHRSSGLLTWLVASARLIWRRYLAYLPPFPTDTPRFQQVAAKANEYGLYILLMTMPLTGLARVLLRGQPFDVFLWQVPALVSPDPILHGMFAKAHEVGATILMVLIGLHAGAALFHGLFMQDDVMQRMLPMEKDQTRKAT